MQINKPDELLFRGFTSIRITVFYSEIITDTAIIFTTIIFLTVALSFYLSLLTIL
jgi:hypothetical protein